MGIAQSIFFTLWWGWEVAPILGILCKTRPIEIRIVQFYRLSCFEKPRRWGLNLMLRLLQEVVWVLEIAKLCYLG